MTNKLPLSFFERLPKTDLHVHLDGSLRLSTIHELASEQGVELPSSGTGGLRKALHAGERTGSMVEYLAAFDITLEVMQTEAALYRVAYELAEDAAAENVRYMEVRYSPLLHTRQGLRLTEVVEVVLRGLHDAELDHGIESKVILCGIRNISPASSLEMAELTVAYKDGGVVGFDLAGAEFDSPSEPYDEAFSLVRRNNINVTIHAGELSGPPLIAQALHACGAHRIGHGCRLRERGDLLHYVVDHRIPLECCPSSNVQTGAVASLQAHPLRLYKDLGVRVTINTDNRLIADTTMSKELWLAHSQIGLAWSDIRQIIINGFKSAFLPFHEKQRYLSTVSQQLDAFAADGTIDEAMLAAATMPGRSH